ncbi:MAG: type II toxin-antitoxin system death-on-curing family toxin [Nanoarchaeota archaeon]|nr:type II toxin-antitoxin system death-on-curing family toxin [Nanoarchaeota archaeon]
MVEYLYVEEIIEINKLCLELSNENEEFILLQPDDLEFVLNFSSENFADIYDISLAYCISLIVLHLFKNGNHRTSLIAAEHFLLKNNYQYIGSEESDLKIQKWRIHFENKNDLEREFFRITCIEDLKKKSEEIKNIMRSKYGKTIEKWLKENFNES